MESNDFGDRCAVCFEKMESSIKLECSHRFHIDWANQLIKTDNCCWIWFEPIQIPGSKSKNLVNFGKGNSATLDSDNDSDNEIVKFMQEEENDNLDDD